MRLTFRTRVAQSPGQVWAGFDQTLFEALAPPFPPVRLIRFDGSRKGDLVELELNFLLFRQRWQSEIVEDAAEGGGFRFVDVGRKLPFFLKSWRHHHGIEPDPAGSGSIIVDDIRFDTPLGWLGNVLFYPSLWAQFAYRGPVYRKVFA